LTIVLVSLLINNNINEGLRTLISNIRYPYGYSDVEEKKIEAQGQAPHKSRRLFN